MLIDTHCHLDAADFAADLPAVLRRAADAGLGAIVIPAVSAKNFARVRELAHAHENCYYALGIHPLYVEQAGAADLDVLAGFLQAWHADPKLVALGEIGLDFWQLPLAAADQRQRQEDFFQSQLALARQFALPVLLHVRKAQDSILRALRRTPVPGGIAHAFNGSNQQAAQFIQLGFALGFGGAATNPRALQIRRLLAQLPLSALVLETDAPDMAPVWLRAPGSAAQRNEPAQLARIAKELAALRALPFAQFTAACAANSLRVLPRLQVLEQ